MHASLTSSVPSYIIYCYEVFFWLKPPRSRRPILVSEMASRAKNTIDYEKLKELMKDHMPLTGNEFMYTDQKALLAQHAPFFDAVALHTARLNPLAVTRAAKDLFQMDQQQGGLFGNAMASAFAYCRTAGNKSIAKGMPGVKLGDACVGIYNTLRKSPSFGISKKGEVPIKAEPRSFAAQKPKRELQKSLSSPSKVLNLYGVKQEPKGPVVKQEPVKQERKEQGTKKEVIQYIYIYIYINIAHSQRRPHL